MNSRERLLTALNGQTPDRVPISTGGLVGYNSQAWENSQPSYARLMTAIREKTDCICMWNPIPKAAISVDERTATLSSDMSFVESAYPAEMEVEEWREGQATITRTTVHTPQGDLSQTVKYIDDTYTPWKVEHWCKSPRDVDRALSIPYEPVDYDDSDYDRIKAEVGENGIIMVSTGDPLCLAAELMEFGEYTLWAMTETEHFARTIDVMHERHMENLKRMLEVNVVDLYRIYGPEYATPPFLPPRFFKRFVVPYVAEMVDLIHSKGAKVRLHSHGKINKVLDMIVETGADATDPCEAPPDGDITLAEVKERAGDKLCIFGNIQLKLLEQGSGEQVESTVKECMAAAKTNGGYVMMPTAEPINIPLAEKTKENYLRFIDAALEYGAY